MKVMETLEKAFKWYCESAQAVYMPFDWNQSARAHAAHSDKAASKH